MSLSVLFLDIDGVLITWQSPDMRTALPRCVKRLNELTDATGALLCVSSVWRFHRNPSIEDTLRKWGVKAEVIGCTPRIDDAERGDEIAAWLHASAGTVSSFVIIDDDSDMGKLMPWLVRTTMRYGMTHATVKAASAVLRNGAHLLGT